MSRRCYLVSILLLYGALVTFGEQADRADTEGEKAVDKSGYNLFKPTPSAPLREMGALYENAYTVDAGHVQVETYPFGYRFHEEHSAHQKRVTEGWTFAPMNLRLGVLRNVESQLALSPYTTVRMNDCLASRTEKAHGFGDLVPRVRVNLWGN